jgi:hypothetical protein
VVIVEVNDTAQRLTVVVAILDANISRHARKTTLDPCIRAEAPRLWNGEVLHDSKRFCMRPVICMEETVRAPVFVCVRKGKLIADRILLQELAGVAGADIVVRLRAETRANEVRPEHYIEVRGRAGIGGRLRSARLPRRLSESDSREKRHQNGNLHSELVRITGSLRGDDGYVGFTPSSIQGAKVPISYW